MLSIKNNIMANEVARNLGLAYDSLGVSVNRLSSGLRINSAADDAAGLAVRELMRADIGALSQGRRNAMDGVSLLQTAEAGLGQMDQLLIRMRELSEQASTGTYTKAQKRTIQNEYDAIVEEINRIANQMNFNGINLLNTSESIAISIGDGPNNRGKFIQIDAQIMDAASLQIGGLKTYAENKATAAVDTQDTNFINFGGAAPGTNTSEMRFTFAGGTYIGFGPTVGTTQLTTVDSMYVALDNGTGSAGVGTVTTNAAGVTYHIGTGNRTLANVVSAINSAASQYATATSNTQYEAWAPAKAYFNASDNRWYLDVNQSVNGEWGVEAELGRHTVLQSTSAAAVSSADANFMSFGTASSIQYTFGTASYAAWVGSVTQTVSVGSMTVTLTGGTAGAAGTVDVGTNSVVTYYLGTGTFSLTSIANAINASAASYGSTYTQFANWSPASPIYNSTTGQYSLNLEHNITGAWSAAANVSGSNGLTFSANGSTVTTADWTSTAGINGTNSAIQFSQLPTEIMQGIDWLQNLGEGITIDLVNGVCPAVTAVDTAIDTKDQYRAYLGYMMNRLVSVADTIDVQNLQLQGAESRISDADVAMETANMTRNLVLAQAGVAMLSMANGLPQMALSLLGGR
ncbi:MAG: hypothetical protein HZA50_08775 [Planctomycetes bacterium]|nr:hypothetical protein [Planctomycetota bacterium]